MSKKSASLFGDIKLTWWQAGLFKTSTISFGILLALLFPDILRPYQDIFWITFAVPAAYILYIYFKK